MLKIEELRSSNKFSGQKVIIQFPFPFFSAIFFPVRKKAHKLDKLERNMQNCHCCLKFSSYCSIVEQFHSNLVDTFHCLSSSFVDYIFKSTCKAKLHLLLAFFDFRNKSFTVKHHKAFLSSFKRSERFSKINANFWFPFHSIVMSQFSNA